MINAPIKAPIIFTLTGLRQKNKNVISRTFLQEKRIIGRNANT